MKFSLGLIGLPNAGKSTLFNALMQRQLALTAPRAFSTIEPLPGTVDLPDPFLPQLQEVAASARCTAAQLQVIDLAGLVEGAHQGQGLGNQFLARIREVKALLHLLRCFPLQRGEKVNPRRAYEIVRRELQEADRMTLLRQEAKLKGKGDKKKILLRETVLGAEKILAAGEELRIHLKDEEKELLRPLNLLTLKPELVVFNIQEQQQGDDFIAAAAIEGTSLAINAREEEELASLPPTEAAQWRQEFNLGPSALEQLLEAARQFLQLIIFYTVNKNESRAWLAQAGISAAAAAAKVHSQMEKGFIKAWVCPASRWLENGGWEKAMARGQVRFVGRDYVVQNYDLLQFHFR